MKMVHDYSTSWNGKEEGSPEEEAAESPAMEKAEEGSGKPQLAESVLDSHHETLMKAHAIKSNPHIMKQLHPHIQKKLAQASDVAMESTAGGVASPAQSAPGSSVKSPKKPATSKITSVEGLRAKAKSL